MACHQLDVALTVCTLGARASGVVGHSAVGMAASMGLEHLKPH